MKMTATDLELLRQFARDHSQDAFTTLVNRHVNLVYSAALRQIRSPQLAEEIAQSVFADLARNADKLVATSGSPVLTAWLYQVARRTAIDVIRQESRRQLREQIAAEMNVMNATTNDWTHIEPLLDDAMAALDETDRTAILLRYFENKNLREVGETLGTNEDAAQKRVSRAVERLRAFFSKRNVTIGASGLTVLISANAVQSAPIGLAAMLATTSLTGVTAGSLTTMKTVTFTKLKLAFNAFVIISAVTALVIQHQMQSALRVKNQQLQQQILQLQADLANYSNQLASVGQTKQLPDEQFSELLKLRGQIGVLRRKLAEVKHPSPDVNALMHDSRTNSPTPQIHIKARFIAMPQETSFGLNGFSSKASDNGDSPGVFNNQAFQNIWQELQSHEGVEEMAEPEVVTASGRQTQMRATQIINVVTNFTLQESNGVANLLPQTEPVETGPMLAVTPRVLPDGYSIELPAIASVVDFLGYQPAANAAAANTADAQEIGGFKTSVFSGVTLAYTKTGQEIDVPTVSPQFRVQQATNSVSLLDNQTLVLMLNNDPIPVGATLLEPDGSKSKFQNKKTVVLVTATLVDAAGNRVHTDKDTLTNTPASTGGQ
jgi:RNA polymerase sigma factor (sigma-70 family)